MAVQVQLVIVGQTVTILADERVHAAHTPEPDDDGDMTTVAIVFIVVAVLLALLALTYRPRSRDPSGFVQVVGSGV